MSNNSSANKKISPLPVLALVFGMIFLALQAFDSLISVAIDRSWYGLKEILMMNMHGFISCICYFICIFILLVAVAFLINKASQKYVYSVSFILTALVLALSQVLVIISDIVRYYSYYYNDLRDAFVRVLAENLLEFLSVIVIGFSVIIYFVLIMVLKGERFINTINVLKIVGCVFLGLIFIVSFAINYLSYFDVIRECLGCIVSILHGNTIRLYYVAWIIRLIVIPLSYLFNFLYLAFGMLGGAKIAFAGGKKENT